MLGPSGSGKTTVLRMIAGFESPTEGQILLGGDDVTGRPPFARDVNTVFQDYALFPHMNVLQNVEYGLRVKKVPRQECRTRALEALETVRLVRLRRPQPAPALRWAAAAGRAGAGAGQPSQGAAARRAAGRARPQAAPRDADRAEADAARARHHLRLRDPRPGGGADDERPHRGLPRRPGRAGRHPRRALRGAVDPVRRRLRRHLEPAGGRGGAGARRRPGPVSIRPEKITLPSRPAPTSRTTRTAASPPVWSREVVYLGAATHSVVDLDVGGRLTVLQQNLGSPSTDPVGRRGEQVTLSWQRVHVVRLGPPRPSLAAATGRHPHEETP